MQGEMDKKEMSLTHILNHLIKSRRVESHALASSYLKKVESASVATAFARYDFPVPGGPYNRKALHGRRLPNKKVNNETGILAQETMNIKRLLLNLFIQLLTFYEEVALLLKLQFQILSLRSPTKYHKGLLHLYDTFHHLDIRFTEENEDSGPSTRFQKEKRQITNEYISKRKTKLFRTNITKSSTTAVFSL